MGLTRDGVHWRIHIGVELSDLLTESFLVSSDVQPYGDSTVMSIYGISELN
jgi:hypothetical protein